jgi:hypothetical protein
MPKSLDLTRSHGVTAKRNSRDEKSDIPLGSGNESFTLSGTAEKRADA